MIDILVKDLDLVDANEFVNGLARDIVEIYRDSEKKVVVGFDKKEDFMKFIEGDREYSIGTDRIALKELNDKCAREIIGEMKAGEYKARHGNVGVEMPIARQITGRIQELGYLVSFTCSRSRAVYRLEKQEEHKNVGR